MWSYDDISVFVAVIEQGSLVGASKKLTMPSSTISRRISKLEESLNLQLLERTSRKIHLTEKGKVFYEQCSPLINKIRENTTQLSHNHEEMSGKMKITMPTFLGTEVLGEWLLEFLQQYDAIDLEVDFNNQYTDILDDEVDIAIRIGPLNDSKFIAQYLWTSGFLLCASPGYLKGAPKIETPEDIIHHQALLICHQPKQWEFSHVKTSETIRVQPKGKLVSNDISLTEQAAELGLGLARLPRFSTMPKIKAGTLVSLLDEYELIPNRDIYAVYPSNKFLSKKTQVLLDFIKQKSKLLVL